MNWRNAILGNLFTNRMVFLVGLLGLVVSTPMRAEDSVCAVVKIEILQELTMERQGFEAQLKIGNTLEDKTIDNISVDVWFKDENDEAILASSDPNNTDALFFIKVQSLDNIADVSGSGQLAGGEEATVKWLIIPSPGASNGREVGTLYFVGADFNYTLEGEADTIPVSPDSIYVKPMPQLALDYFIPRDVIGDDPFTDQIESPEPFSLGVRVMNNGTGVAKKLKIDSAQPTIVDNKQGLLINFELIGSSVNDEPVTNSLLVDFGDIASKAAGVARWQMQVSLSGRFTEFGATFSHADELGGQLTSLIDSTTSHFLIHDVKVDLAGRDNIQDFLAEDLESPKVFESDGVEAVVVDQSSKAALTFEQNVGEFARYKMTLPVTADLFYVKLSDPLNGQKELAYAVRSDGKNIDPANVWLSKKQDSTTHNWSYFVNLFDGLGTDTYYLYFRDKVVQPRPPVFQTIPQRTIYEGLELGFLVEASDPDGNAVSLTAGPLPSGATFVDNGNGTGSFNWMPTAGQAGIYPITYTAFDGSQTTTKVASIQVNSASDTDGDGLDDNWEREHFGNLDQDGDGDFDGDGISNLDEFEAGTNPAIPDGPPTPTIVAPAINASVDTPIVDLTIENGVYTGPHNIVFQFEVYADEAMTQKLDYYNSVPADSDGVTRWRPTINLTENTNYFWRVRAYDGYTYSLWADGRFSVNFNNEPPSQPQLSKPALGGELYAASPVLEVINSTDADGDKLFYQFKVYEDVAGQSMVVDSGLLEASGSETGSMSWQIPEPLTVGQSYYWQVTVTDENNASVDSEMFNFVWSVENHAPPVPVISAPLNGEEVISLTPELTIATVADADGDALQYAIQLDSVNTFDSAQLQAVQIDVDSQASDQRWVTAELVDNTVYYVRVRSIDTNGAVSEWANLTFFINVANEAPSTPTIKNPGDQAWVDTLTPNLSVNPSDDPDRDPIRYEFELFADESMTNKLASNLSDSPEWMAPLLADNQWFFWRARALDNENLSSEWSSLNRFFVNDNNYNDPPTLSWVAPSESIQVTPNSVINLSWQDEDPDSEAKIALRYFDENDSSTEFVIADNIAEDEDAGADSYSWNIGELAPGTYRLVASISDENSEIRAISEAKIIAIPEPVIPGHILVDSDALIELQESFENPEFKRFSLVLDKAPKSDVIVPIINPESDRLQLSQTQIIFTPQNWNVPQIITLTPINNCFVDENSPFTITVGLAQSDDPAFDNVEGSPVNIQIINDDADIVSRNGNHKNDKLAMCGLTKKYSFDLWQFHFDFYNFYAMNVADREIKKVTLRAKLNDKKGGGLVGRLRYKNLAADTIQKAAGEFYTVSFGDESTGYPAPDSYQIKIRKLKFRK